jgi:hypothetical protein
MQAPELIQALKGLNAQQRAEYVLYVIRHLDTETWAKVVQHLTGLPKDYYAEPVPGTPEEAPSDRKEEGSPSPPQPA